MNTTIKLKLKINGMHCSSCAMNIDFDLEDLEGVKSARTNYAKSISEVEFDADKISEDDVVKQIRETGYDASVMTE